MTITDEEYETGLNAFFGACATSHIIEPQGFQLLLKEEPDMEPSEFESKLRIIHKETMRALQDTRTHLLDKFVTHFVFNHVDATIEAYSTAVLQIQRAWAFIELSDGSNHRESIRQALVTGKALSGLLKAILDANEKDAEAVPPPVAGPELVDV